MQRMLPRISGCLSVLLTIAACGLRPCAATVAPPADTWTGAPAHFVQDDGRLPGFEPVSFLFANSRILPEARSTLNRLAAWLRERPELEIELHGHADPSTEQSFGPSIARERAEAARAFLVERGVAPERLHVRSFGTARPVGDDSFDGRRLNRRVVFARHGSAPPPPAATSAPAPPAPRAAPPSPVTAGLDPARGGWTILLASAPSYDEAEAHLARYRHLGHPVDVLRSLSREVKRFYAALGQFETREEAERIFRELARELPPGSRTLLLEPWM